MRKTLALLTVLLLQGCTTYAGIALNQKDPSRPLGVIRFQAETENTFRFCEHISFLLENENDWGLNMCGGGVKF